MTEYAAIHIDFTLQGLYTCTHSPRIQPASYSNYLRSTETRLTATAPFLSPRLGCNPLVVGAPWSCVALPLPSEVPPSPHAPPASGLPRTTLLLTGLVTHRASSDRIHQHSG